MYDNTCYAGIGKDVELLRRYRSRQSHAYLRQFPIFNGYYSQIEEKTRNFEIKVFFRPSLIRNTLHDDTDPPGLSQERLYWTTPWPTHPIKPSDRGAHLPGNTLARRRTLWRAPCREFIRVVQNTEEFI